MKRFLITTALEETWRDDEPVLFLGEWCRLYSRQERWSAMDAEVLPYHWDDRAKLYADYQYLQGFYERTLEALATQLNQIHGVDHGLRYWRILLGPWLGYFIQMLFDRWATVQQAINCYDLSGTMILSGREEYLVPNDMADFSRLFVGDEWNHHIFANILQELTSVPCIPLTGPHPVSGTGVRVSSDIHWKRRVKRKLASWYAQATSALSRNEDSFFISTHLPFRAEMALHLRMGQAPQFWRSIAPIKASVDLGQRLWTVAGEGLTEFESCARVLIPRQIPAAYLEGYRQLVEQVEGLSWPKRPKVIFTSNAENSDDVFKAWAAEQVEHGTPLAIGQHGGHYGIGQLSFVEEHEIAISDCYLSWGWSDPEQPKVRPVGQLKSKRPLGVRHAEQAGAVLVTALVPRYSYFLYSVIVARQWLDFLEDQFSFVERLPIYIQNALTIRLYAQDWGWSQAARWRDRFPEVYLDDGHSNINELIGQSRLYIATYNATTFLESFAMNVPTIIYWNPCHWELREAAVPYFEELKRVGIFHETPESAARQVTAIWDDVDAWWGCSAVQEVVENFKRRYCFQPDNLLERVEQALQETITIFGKTSAQS